MAKKTGRSIYADLQILIEGERCRQDMSWPEIARQLGCSYSTIVTKAKEPEKMTLGTLSDLARVLHIEPARIQSALHF